MNFATRTYMERSIERLYGIIDGINIDSTINEKEIIALKNWLDVHEAMHHIEPFSGLVYLLSEILEDGIIDADEKQELSEWCADTLNNHGFLDCFTKTIRRLHGIISGMLCDEKIRAEELVGLRDWMLDYENLNNWWPFNELKKHIDIILEDGVIDETEQMFLKEFFSDFVEQAVEDPVILDDEYWLNRHVMSLSPVFEPIATICEKEPSIKFKNKTFCFTGPAATGKRKDLFFIVQEKGGIPKKNPVIDLDYLVIGAQASPAWVYSTYGRKIEAVLNRKNNSSYCQTSIVSELDFISALEKKGHTSLVYPFSNK